MDKGRRHELKILHFKRRMKKMGPLAIKDGGNYYAYRSHSTPCSCWCCRGLKYNRSKEKTSSRKIAEPVSEAVLFSQRPYVRNQPFISEIEGCD